MKSRILFFMIFVSQFLTAQVNETFADGNFSENPVWTGITGNFIVNTSLELQSSATSASTSYLFTPSAAFVNAVWECRLKINYTTSSSNYAAVYLASDRSDITNGCNAYYVQIGGTNDEVSLFVQQGTKKSKIIDGTDKRTDGKPVEITVKVTRDANGILTLYSKKASETEYVKEGAVMNTQIKNSSYFGVLYTNTSTTGSDYFFDDITVTGDKAPDTQAPVWTTFTLEQPDKLHLGFSEPMDFSRAVFSLDQGMGNPVSKTTTTDRTGIVLTFSSLFEKGKVYQLTVSGLADLGGNILDSVRSIGIAEPAVLGDVVWNEVMFENPENSLEYVEIYNRSEKVLDASALVFTTRKTDGSFNTPDTIPAGTYILPKGYLAVCSDASIVRNYHKCPAESNIVSSEWTTLNNESATLVLCNSSKDSVYDELTYNADWHHVLVKNPKGVALERINPDLPTQSAASWHSAASEVNYGTPGYKNSQFRENENTISAEKIVWTEPEAFSPDNDGTNDVCFIRYKMDANGYMVNALILNAVGEKVYTLVTNELLASEGYMTWDGRTNRGTNANVGVYVLYFEIFNPEKGLYRQIKLPVVVSSR